MFTNFGAVVKSSITDILFYVSYLTTFDGNNKSANAVANLVHSTESKIARMNFVITGETAVPCPDGFKENFPGYIATLNEERDIIISTTYNALNNFNTYLASFIGNKDSKISLKDDHKVFLAMKDLREKQVKKFESFFTSGVNQRQKLDVMYESKALITPSAKEAVQLWKYVKVINPRDIQERCTTISQRMQQVMDLSTSKSNSAVSKQALMNIAEGSYEVAKQVEHLGLFLARSEIASVTTGNVLERLDKIIK